jgi:hypothetical protein
MKIKLFPSLDFDTIAAVIDGDKITINGEIVDLSGIPDGYRLPAIAVGNRFFLSGSGDYVERIGKTLHFTLRLPVAWNSPEEYRNPVEPIVIDARSGPVKFPDTSPPAPPVIELPEIQEEPENGGFEPA